MGCDLKRVVVHADGRLVIELHRLHGNGTIVVNADLIETLEACPDTVVTLVTKRRFVVEDPLDEIIAKIIAYRARIAAATGAAEDHAVGGRAVAILQDENEAA
jgi:flagellar protein FlbD